MEKICGTCKKFDNKPTVRKYSQTITTFDGTCSLGGCKVQMYKSESCTEWEWNDGEG